MIEVIWKILDRKQPILFIGGVNKKCQICIYIASMNWCAELIHYKYNSQGQITTCTVHVLKLFLLIIWLSIRLFYIDKYMYW
jgi:hypothetical protein